MNDRGSSPQVVIQPPTVITRIVINRAVDQLEGSLVVDRASVAASQIAKDGGPGNGQVARVVNRTAVPRSLSSGESAVRDGQVAMGDDDPSTRA